MKSEHRLWMEWMPVTDQFASNVMLAWNGKLSFPDLIGSASELELQGFPQLAAVLYQTWLARVDSPYAHAVHDTGTRP